VHPETTHFGRIFNNLVANILEIKHDMNDPKPALEITKDPYIPKIS